LPHNFKTKQNMKKIIFAAAALFAFGFANAQDTKEESAGGMGFANGDVFVSGSIGFSSTSSGDFDSNTFTIAPRVGFFVSDNIAVGARLGYTSNTDFAETKTNTFEIGGFGRWYATPASQFSLMVELGVDYRSSSVEPDGGEESKVNGFGIGVRPGISYFLSDNWAMEAMIGELGYETSKPDADGAESTDTFGLNLNLESISFGVIYKF
jgi:opacity protein-like surface antigen